MATTKPLSIFTIRVVRRVDGIADNQPRFAVAAPSRAAAIRAFDAAHVRTSVSDLKNYGNEWVPDSRPSNDLLTTACVAKPGTVFATHGIARDEAPVVPVPPRG